MKRERGRGSLFGLWLLIFAVAPLSSALAAGPENGLDSRGWELISPVDKNGGEVSTPGGPGAGAFQAAAVGGAFAYASDASFGEAAGAPPQSQYIGVRGSGGWSSLNLSPPLLSGTYPGGAYQLFSADLSRAILANGWGCRAGEASCPAANPPLAPGAPLGYRNLYLRDNASGTYTPIVTTTNSPALALSSDDFRLALAGASPDLTHIVISTCAALTAGSTEVPGPEGCDPGSPNFYEWVAGTMTEVELDEWEADFDPGGAEVLGVLGASADRSYVYYANAGGLWLWHGGVSTKVAAAADASNYPASTGTARVSADGTRLAFLSSAQLTAYNNAGKVEVYLYNAQGQTLLCASCRPKGTAPKGSSTIPGARAAGDGPPLYKPRALSADGTRLFFDSADAVLPNDTDGLPDVYQWEANGSGGCAKAAGCVALISGGRLGSATFLDASADGTDAFFRTPTSLLPFDPGAADVYDARAGGGFPEPASPIPCFGDACQGPAPAPDDPAPGTSLVNARGNPKPACHCKRKHHKKKKHHHRRKKPGAGHRGGRR